MLNNLFRKSQSLIYREILKDTIGNMLRTFSELNFLLETYNEEYERRKEKFETTLNFLPVKRMVFR